MLNISFLVEIHNPLKIREFITAESEQEMRAVNNLPIVHAFQELPHYGLEGGNAYLMEICAALGKMDHVLFLLEHQVETMDADTKNRALLAAFQQAVSNNHHDIASLLFMTSTDQVFSAIETLPAPNDFFNIQLEESLTELRQRRDSFEPASVDDEFDIEDDEVGKYLVILRRLIRQNSDAATETLADLITIPAIAARLHDGVAAGGNELLRFALTHNNQPAAAALLEVEAVRRLAEHNNYYEVQGGGAQIDLRGIAEQRESSMNGLSAEEQGFATAAQNHYAATVRQLGGVDAAFQLLVSDLEAEYRLRPAIYLSRPETININGRATRLPNTREEFDRLVFESREQRAAVFARHYIPLPYSRADFDRLPLSFGDRNLALQAYYKHPLHTAIRYLSIPNPWLSPEAVHAVHVDGRPHHASFEACKSTLALFWLAARDAASPAINGYTIESRKEGFINELALIGRAHNWDLTRNVIGPDGRPVRLANGSIKTEEYDDGVGDKPSCGVGVNKRLNQAVRGHSLFTAVTPGILQQNLNEIIFEYYQTVFSRMTASQRAAIKEDLNNACIMLEQPSARLVALNIPPAQIQFWIAELTEKYRTPLTTVGLTTVINSTFMLAPLHTAHVCKYFQSHHMIQLLEAKYPSPPSMSTFALNLYLAMALAGGVIMVAGMLAAATAATSLSAAAVVVACTGAGILAVGGGLAIHGIFSRRAAALQDQVDPLLEDEVQPDPPGFAV